MMNVEIGFSAIIAIANVMDRDLVAANVGVGKHGYVRLPVMIIGGLKSEPPGEDECKGTCGGADCEPAAFKENPDCNDREQEECRE